MPFVVRNSQSVGVSSDSVIVYTKQAAGGENTVTIGSVNW